MALQRLPPLATGAAFASRLLLLFLSISYAASFVAPKAFVPPGQLPSVSSSLDALPPAHQAVIDVVASRLPPFLLSQELEEGLGGSIVDVPTQETFDALTSSAGGGGGGGIMESVLGTVQTVLVFFTALAFAVAGLTFIFGAFLIPKAAEQLEKETKELAPELWDEYQSKLEEGETLAQRPDLLKELGDKVQPLIDAKVANAYKEQLQENEKVMEELPPVSPPGEGESKGGGDRKE